MAEVNLLKTERRVVSAQPGDNEETSLPAILTLECGHRYASSLKPIDAEVMGWFPCLECGKEEHRNSLEFKIANSWLEYRKALVKIVNDHEPYIPVYDDKYWCESCDRTMYQPTDFDDHDEECAWAIAKKALEPVEDTK